MKKNINKEILFTIFKGSSVNNKKQKLSERSINKKLL